MTISITKCLTGIVLALMLTACGGSESRTENPVNLPPAISGLPVTQVHSGGIYYFLPQVADEDTDRLSFSISNKPAWASFNAFNGMLIGQPSEEDIGIIENVRISVSDGAHTSMLPAFNIKVVMENHKPLISGVPRTRVSPGEHYDFTPQVSDADGDTLQFIIANKPSWAGFDNKTGQLSGVPQVRDIGLTSRIVIIVSDGQSGVHLPGFAINVLDSEPTEPTEPGGSEKVTLLSVYYGNQGWDMNQVLELEGWQGKKHAVINLFTDWHEKSESLLFDYQLNYIWEHGSIPSISWEPYPQGNSVEDIERKVVSGEYDNYLYGWAGKLKLFLDGVDGIQNTDDDRRAYIRFAHEPNGNWYPWSAEEGIDTPDDYIAMWRHVVDIFSELGINKSQLQWVWNISATDYGDFTAEQYYPGDNYVDWVGLDGYNWGNSYEWLTWRSPEEVFEPMRQRLQEMAPGKPISMNEVGSSSSFAGEIDITRKAVWLEELFVYLKEANIGLLSWFNIDKETDWQVFDGMHGTATSNGVTVYPEYKTGVSHDWVLGADTRNPRIITDLEFQGIFSQSPGISP